MKTILFNPFEKYAEKTLIFIGIICTLLGSYLAFLFNARFDGALDFHLNTNPFLTQTFVDNFINVFCLLLPLYIVGKIVNNKTRWIDILSSILVSRIPYSLLPLFNINNTIQNATYKLLEIQKTGTIENLSIANLVLIIVFSIVSILFLVWMIALLYNGYKTATNGKGKKPVILFIVALISAEILSKVLISFFH
ncbi:YIP1 family protein [Wenyingzhuangia sp. IMCC45574]